jgi:REP element-mobilizing transposase RayT
MWACMARKPRVEFEGAFYHVIVRGNQRQRIFRDRDRMHYLERVEDYRQRYRFTIYAYVLMSNHVHLLLETGKTPLSFSRLPSEPHKAISDHADRRYDLTNCSTRSLRFMVVEPKI